MNTTDGIKLQADIRAISTAERRIEFLLSGSNSRTSRMLLRSGCKIMLEGIRHVITSIVQLNASFPQLFFCLWVRTVSIERKPSL